MYDLIIIGGGPAGISAGIYAARKKIKTLLLTKDFVGQIGKTGLIENYPGFSEISGLDLMNNFKNHLKKFEIEIKEEEAKDMVKKGNEFEILTSKNNKFLAKAVIIATGRNPRPLMAKGESEFEGKGVSYCSICDAPFFKDKIVAVVGGGNSGFETALDLTKYSPKIYVLEVGQTVRADELTQERARVSGKISVLTNVVTKEIKGENSVKGLVYEDKTSGKQTEIALEGIFIEIGSVPATAFLNDLLEFNESGEIKIDQKTCAANVSGVFAAGDITDVKYKQIAVAVGEGVKAALSAYAYIENLNTETKK